MADIYNDAINTVVSGTDDADNIKNVADNVTVQAENGADYVTNTGDYALIFGGNGNDTVWNEIANAEQGGSFATIYGGAGDDSIISDGPNSYLDGGDGNDSITTWGEVTVLGGKGDDILILRDDGNGFDEHINLVKYSLGDGNDTIYYFNSADTLNISGSSYSSIESGNDIIFTVGEGTDSVGTITLIDAAGTQLNITGDGGSSSSGTTETTSGGITTTISENTNATDYVFIFDTSGSMDTYITRVKDIAADFTKQLTSQGVDYRLGIVEYESISEIQTYDFTTDVNEFSANVSTIADKATNHYRSDEYGLTAIETALTMDYREGANKRFIVLTDEDYTESHYSSSTLDSTTVIANLNSNSVMLDVIGEKDSGSYYSCEDAWTPIANATEGNFYDINGDYNSIFTSISGGSSEPYMQLSRWSYNFTFPTSGNSSNMILASAT